MIAARGITGKLVLSVGALCGAPITLVGLPGMWLSLGCAGLAEYFTDERLYSNTTMAGCLLLTIAGDVWEFTASSARAKRAGAGRRGTIGALLGGIAGAILGSFVLPLIGTLIGGGVGALVASAALEQRGGRSVPDALRIGRAAAAGQLMGVAGKFVAAAVLVSWILIATWW